jgi:integrase
MTYVNIRPSELINIKEGDFDLSLGIVNVRYNKESKPKIVKLLEEDIELVKSFPSALPHLYFFRHGNRKGVPRSKAHRFGKDYLYTWWKRACKNLGIENVDLYGGTRHSSVRALREYFSPEEIKQYGTTHSTNKAFERYFQHELGDQEKIFKKARVGKKKGEVIKLDLTKK